MEYQVLNPNNAAYPIRLRERLGEKAPALYCNGPIKLLDRFTMAVACSDLIPAPAMIEANQLLFAIREYGINYIGGWHSVMETEIFRLALYRENDPSYIRSLTLFSARGLAQEDWEAFLADRFGERGPFVEFPEKEEYRRRVREGEILMLSIAEPSSRKMDRASIMARNFTACAASNVVFVPFANKGSKTYALVRRVLAAGIPLFTSRSPENADLEKLGIPAYERQTVGGFLEKLGTSKTASSPFPRAEPPNHGPTPVHNPLSRATQRSLFGK